MVSWCVYKKRKCRGASQSGLKRDGDPSYDYSTCGEQVRRHELTAMPPEVNVKTVSPDVGPPELPHAPHPAQQVDQQIIF